MLTSTDKVFFSLDAELSKNLCLYCILFSQENELPFKAGIFEIENKMHCMDSVCNIIEVC